MDMIATMRVVREVSRLGSFTAAGRELKLSTPSISRLVGELETDLGVRLFNRTTRRIALTEAGEQFLRRSTIILEEIETLCEETRERHGNPKGRLRISCVNGFGNECLAPAIPEFLERHPDLRIEVDISNRQVDLVEEHYDVAIRVGKLADSSMAARRIFVQNFIFVAAPESGRRHGAPQALADLQNHRTIMQISGTWGRIHQLEGPDGIVEYRVPDNFVLTSPIAVRNATLKGYGCALLANFMVADDIAAGRLVRLLPEYESMEQSIYAVFPHRTYIPAKVRVFIDYLVECFGHGN
jgi:LysR family transcriptional regulator for bpeEF and oprC